MAQICEPGRFSNSLLEALSLGHRPIILPRLAEHGEHVDDHQVELAESLFERSLAVDARLGPAAVEEALRTRIAPVETHEMISEMLDADVWIDQTVGPVGLEPTTTGLKTLLTHPWAT